MHRASYSVPQRSSVSVGAIARSSSSRPTTRARLRRARVACSPQRPPPCAKRTFPQWSTSTPRASDYTRNVADQGQVKTDELDAQAEAKRRLALAQIRQYPDPVLRLEAQEVQDFDDDLTQLVERMKRLMQ